MPVSPRAMPWSFARAMRWLALALAVASLVAIGYLDLARIAFYWITSADTQRAPAGPELDLHAYRVAIEARPIRGLSANASGLTYSQKTGSLFAVINRPPALAELSLDGQLLRLVPLPTIKDPEGIAHVEDDMFVIADESDNRLHWVSIRPGEGTVTPVDTTRLPLDFSHLHNFGFEGVSWDESRAELLVVNEKWPRRVLMVNGLAQRGGTQMPTLQVHDWSPSAWLGTLGSDLASITAHSRTGNLLVLSEESAAVTEYSRQGTLLGVLPLWPGIGGLKQKVPQPEGISIGPDDSIYIISEPNLFYRFTRTGRQ
ncbi:SdiA-regulated domain-containing protein [Pseudorhodoferax sp.]|uniref:SdiA-regulated domain-containing protein n=1 Tax=Pseudorhodoferax sp. TaxID=1993553 RepID=UPI0039E6142F